MHAIQDRVINARSGLTNTYFTVAKWLLSRLAGKSNIFLARLNCST